MGCRNIFPERSILVLYFLSERKKAFEPAAANAGSVSYTHLDFGVHADPYQGMIEQAIKSKIRLSDYFGGDVNEVSLDVSVFPWTRTFKCEYAARSYNIDSIPVSYTHLDVYKRQDICDIRTPDSIWVFRIKLFIKDILQFATEVRIFCGNSPWFYPLCFDCLLYTSSNSLGFESIPSR